MGAKTDQDVIDRIRFLAVQGVRPPKIEDQLNSDAKIRGRVPDIRTIQRYASATRPVRARDWSFLPADKSQTEKRPKAPPSSGDRSLLTPEDASLVMETIGSLLEVTDGRVGWLSDDEARLIIWLRRAFPGRYGIGPLQAYLIAVEYLRQGSNHRALDSALAIRDAWMQFEDGESLWKHKYRHAVKQGWVPAGPEWIDKEEHEMWTELGKRVLRKAEPTD